MLNTFLFAVGVIAVAIEPPSYPTTTRDDCNTLCVDYISDCGQMYGGCFQNCPGVPWPTYTSPPCPSTTTSSACPTPTGGPECPRTICVDYINECGRMYGGCYDECGPKPTFEDPGCPPEDSSDPK